MAETREMPQDLDKWVAAELQKLLPQITEDAWSEVWGVISPVNADLGE
ncbi:hypothetical protein [Streptomyces sp. AS02]|nr:hypothetical protein [Streptomyces sp. AS02]MCL8016479.1 hypothetical protein [Streptomyces sp. AS02]